MHTKISILSLLPFLGLSLCANPIGPNPNSKRGLVYVPSEKTPQDDKVWVQAGSPLTWYYNYKTLPSTPLEGGPTTLEFVPMLWGDYDNTFVDDVKGLIKKGYNITSVLGFNEPDNPQTTNTGGSGITPEAAAARWKESIQPLAKLGIKLGSPSPTGAPAGLTWMQSFFAACDGCTFDFIPLHWYGNFDGIASHLGTYSAAFPNMTFWVTEFALDHASEADTQAFFNLTMEYFDRMENVEKYSYFGSFRSSVANVGAKAAMLDKNGGLTWLGAWYLNKDASAAASEVGTSGSGNGAMGLSVSILSLVIAGVVGSMGVWVL